MNNKLGSIRIAFDAQTLLDYKVDQKVYQDRLAEALPNHRLEFCFGPVIRDSIYMPYALSIVGGDDPKLTFDVAKTIWKDVCGTLIQQSQDLGTEERVRSDQS
jgi:hypothetical protein